MYLSTKIKSIVAFFSDRSLRQIVGSSPRQGYVYVRHDDGALPDSKAMADAKPGDRIRLDQRKPSCIVVYHDISAVSATGWPGSLWKVEIVEAATPTDHLVQYGLAANYTRVVEVQVLEQVPVAALFGAHGTKVCAVINAAGELTLERAARLVDARHPLAGEAQTRFWRALLARNYPQSINRDGVYEGIRGVAAQSSSVPTRVDEYDGTIVVGTSLRTPIESGLTVLSNLVDRRAETVMGKSVWIVDPEDPEEQYLAEPWPRAARALLDAAISFGAPEFVSESDHLIFRKAWRDVFGLDPV